MRAKSVWLHDPFGNPKKTQFKVSDSEISLGNFVVPAAEVASCGVRYSNKFVARLNPTIGLALIGWFLYEAFSLMIRFTTAVNVASNPGADEAATHAAMLKMLTNLHLRASTTDDQQLQLTFWIYILTILYSIFIAPNIFRPRLELIARGGSVVCVSYRLVRPRKFAKTLVAARKIAQRNKKLSPTN